MSGSSTPRRLSAAQYALASKKDVHHGIKSFRSCDYRPYISCAGRKPTVRIYGSDIRRDRWIVVWIDTGVISGALIFIKKTFGLSTFEQGLAVSSVLVGAAVTAITGGSLSDRLGRRKMLLITSVIFMAGAVVCSAAGSIQVLVVGRVILGVGIGLASSVVPLSTG